jgi:hypothetical protein
MKEVALAAGPAVVVSALISPPRKKLFADSRASSPGERSGLSKGLATRLFSARVI